MKKLNQSPKKSNDENIVGLTEMQKAEETLRLAKEQEADKFANPKLKAVIIENDRNTLRRKFVKI